MSTQKLGFAKAGAVEVCTGTEILRSQGSKIWSFVKDCQENCLGKRNILTVKADSSNIIWSDGIRAGFVIAQMGNPG